MQQHEPLDLAALAFRILSGPPADYGLRELTPDEQEAQATCAEIREARERFDAIHDGH